MTSQPLYKFKEIATVPGSKELVDIILSKTQRKTPTQIHAGFKVSRIRSFYMRKIKFCQTAFHEKFATLLQAFPRLDDIHPFYADLCNVLYDRDHYKLALGQVNAVRNICDNVAKDYVRLMKYADSPYKCKMLKRAALGRMCTAVRKLQASLAYLEEVRQHLARLPSINPTTRTLILTGYPNVGKSSFMNQVSNANVDVQPYAFTTKSLFVGHFDYNYTRWQVIDTPGILDHPLEERNTIEMTAITALAHLQASVMYFVDVSGNCGWTVQQQVALFRSIKPLFKNKPVLVVLNKIDVKKVEDLNAEEKAALESMKEGMENLEFLQTSCLAQLGVDAAKNTACELLLARRIASKVESRKADTITNRLTVTQMQTRADRPPCIPPSVLKEREMRGAGVEPAKRDFQTEKELQEEQGGAGVYSVDLKKRFMLADDDWKYDVVPEFFDGKNVADFIDPDIDRRLRELEAEEAQLLQEEGDMDLDDTDWQATQKLLAELHSKMEQKRLENRLRRSRNSMAVPRRKGQTVEDVEEKLGKLGYETEGVKARAEVRGRSLTREAEARGEETPADKKRKRQMSKAGMEVDDEGDDFISRASSRVRSRSAAASERGGMDVDDGRKKKKIRSTSAHRSMTPSRVDLGLGKGATAAKKDAAKAKKLSDKKIFGKKGESDRFIGTAMPKHLYSGKRGIGKHDRR